MSDFANVPAEAGGNVVSDDLPSLPFADAQPPVWTASNDQLLNASLPIYEDTLGGAPTRAPSQTATMQMDQETSAQDAAWLQRQEQARMQRQQRPQLTPAQQVQMNVAVLTKRARDLEKTGLSLADNMYGQVLQMGDGTARLVQPVDQDFQVRMAVPLRPAKTISLPAGSSARGLNPPKQFMTAQEMHETMLFKQAYEKEKARPGEAQLNQAYAEMAKPDSQYRDYMQRYNNDRTKMPQAHQLRNPALDTVVGPLAQYAPGVLASNMYERLDNEKVYLDAIKDLKKENLRVRDQFISLQDRLKNLPYEQFVNDLDDYVSDHNLNFADTQRFFYVNPKTKACTTVHAHLKEYMREGQTPREAYDEIDDKYKDGNYMPGHITDVFRNNCKNLEQYKTTTCLDVAAVRARLRKAEATRKREEENASDPSKWSDEYKEFLSQLKAYAREKKMHKADAQRFFHSTPTAFKIAQTALAGYIERDITPEKAYKALPDRYRSDTYHLSTWKEATYEKVAKATKNMISAEQDRIRRKEKAEREGKSSAAAAAAASAPDEPSNTDTLSDWSDNDEPSASSAAPKAKKQKTETASALTAMASAVPMSTGGHFDMDQMARELHAMDSKHVFCCRNCLLTGASVTYVCPQCKDSKIRYCNERCLFEDKRAHAQVCSKHA